jgi:hypothetical protein
VDANCYSINTFGFAKWFKDFDGIQIERSALQKDIVNRLAAIDRRK